MLLTTIVLAFFAHTVWLLMVTPTVWQQPVYHKSHDRDVQQTNNQFLCRTHMWQSGVEHHFVVYFNQITALKCCKTVLRYTFTHMSCTLNGSSALQRFEHSNEIEIHNRIMFDLYPNCHIYTILTLTLLASSNKKSKFHLSPFTVDHLDGLYG